MTNKKAMKRIRAIIREIESDIEYGSHLVPEEVRQMKSDIEALEFALCGLKLKDAMDSMKPAKIEYPVVRDRAGNSYQLPHGLIRRADGKDVNDQASR